MSSRVSFRPAGEILCVKTVCARRSLTIVRDDIIKKRQLNVKNTDRYLASTHLVILSMCKFGKTEGSISGGT